MFSYPSRSELRQTKLYCTAEKGGLSIDNCVLYPGEMNKYVIAQKFNSLNK